MPTNDIANPKKTQYQLRKERRASKEKAINSIHATRLQKIRPFVSFDFDATRPLSTYQKRKIKTYFDEIDALTARPYQPYRPKTRERLRKAQEFAQHEKRLPGLKVAFIPTNGVDRVKPRFTDSGEFVVSSDHVTTRYIELNKNKLLRDPEGHVKKQIAKKPEAKQFTVLCGRYEIPAGHNRKSIGKYVANLTTKYANEDKNNYFGNWLHGLAAHNFKEQATFGAYLKEKQDNKKRLQRERRNTKRRNKRGK